MVVAIWDNVDTQMGLVHLEHQLSEETVEGNWTIEANKEKKVIEVRKYILPRFKVNLEHPTAIYARANEIIFIVCAK